MKQKVATWDIQEHIQELIKEYPSTKKHFQWIADRLNCKIKDIVGLAVHPDNEKTDEEGWSVESFFAPGTRIKHLFNHKDVHTEEFSFGNVEELQVGADLFISEVNASPFFVYANPHSIEKIGGE